MDVKELIEQLDQRFGNPYAPKHYRIIQEAVKALRKLTEEKEK